MAQDKGWPLDLLNDVCNGESFSGSGNSEQNLTRIATLQTLNQLADGFRLVAGWSEIGGNFKVQGKWYLRV